MNVIKIVGEEGSGKSTALNDLAKLYQTEVLTGAEFEALLPAMERNLVGLAVSTFVDDVPKKMLTRITKLTKQYPDEYFIYLALTN